MRSHTTFYCKSHRLQHRLSICDGTEFSRCGHHRHEHRHACCHRHESAVKAIIQCTCGNCISVQTPDFSMGERCRRRGHHHHRHHHCCG